MSHTFKIMLGLIVVTVIGSFAIIRNVSNDLTNIPHPTPLDIPNAMKKVNKADQTFASQSASAHPAPAKIDMEPDK
jgi:hypothetical protein